MANIPVDDRADRHGEPDAELPGELSSEWHGDPRDEGLGRR